MKLLKRVMHVLTPKQRKQMIGLVFMMLIGAILETVGTSLILPLITTATNPDSVLDNKYMKIVFNTLGLTDVNGFLKLIIIALIVIYVTRGVFLFVMYRAQYRFVYNGQYRTASNLFKEYVQRPYEFYLNASTPVVLRNIVSDVSGVYNLILTLLQLFTEGIVFTALFVLSLVISPIMTICMSLFLGAVLLLNRKFFGPMLHRFGDEVQHNSSMVTKWLMQAMDGMKETKVLNREKYFVDQYEKSAKALNHIQLVQSSLSNVPRLSIETVMFVGILGMLGVFISSSSGVNMSSMIAQVGVLAMVAFRIMPSANRIIQALNNVEYYEPCLHSVENIIVHAHEIKADEMFAKDEVIEPIPFTKEVRLDNITYHYQNSETNIFEHADLVIPIGKSIGIIGPSGAGKSTAVDVLLGLLTPQEGQITVDGYDIRNNLSGWYDNIGYVPQMMYMLDDTIRNNVAYGVEASKVDDEKVWAVLREAQMDEFVRSLPEGLDTGIGERGVRISGGQRQRIGIARALYNDPDIMIFDEATSALDNDTESAIMEAIERLHGRKTLIIVAHRLTTIENCDMVYRVEDRRFVRTK